ncbi:MAG: aminotransferase class I/II-fold pyridoxal phosphate-dependent enzyme [Acidobacteria bacterium]|nr:aminotransferase class I/II-fold pyridoxal phosphate-dependent enzyme [Acidobacteriota bacterium]
MTGATPLRSRLPGVGVSIFAEMTRLANERGAINLSQGFPDFDCAPELVALVQAWLGRRVNQYAPMPGVLSLREALAREFERAYSASYDPVAEITITAGATEGLFSTITALVHPGDEVLLFEPCYDSYVPAVQLAGGVPRFVTLRAPDYRIDWDEVRRALSKSTRLVVINSPHNPTGAVFDADDLAHLAALLDGTPVVVASDEVYEHLVFDGRRHESLARWPALAARTAVIGSFGKTFHTTGWKVGFVAAPAAVTDEIRKVHQFVTFAVTTPVQHAYAEFLDRGVDFGEVTRFYQAKRDRFLELLAGSRFRPLPCHGTYFQILDYSAIASLPDREMALRVLADHGVASIPTSPFLYQDAAPSVLRFCFAKTDDTLERAAARLRQV